MGPASSIKPKARATPQEMRYLGAKRGASLAPPGLSWRGMRGALRVLLALTFGCASSACQHSSADAESIQSGERIFASVCSRCHGVDGKGGIAAGGADAPRNFCDTAFQASRSDADLMQVIQKGKANMPAFGNLFSDSDLRGLVRKLRAFTPAAAAPAIDPGKEH